MANPLPILRGTTGGLNAQVLYPFTRTVSFATIVTPHANGTEQRVSSRGPLNSFKIPMSNLSNADRQSWLALVGAVKGMFTMDITLTIGSTVYSNLAFDTDTFTQVNTEALLWDQDVSLHQVKNYPWTRPTPGSSFPTLSFGGVAERPFSRHLIHRTSISPSRTGPQYTLAWFGGGLSGYPTSGLNGWTIEYPLLRDSDVTLIENQFLGCMGKYQPFNFTDPLSGSIHLVRFDMDHLSIRYLTRNQNSARIDLREVWGE